MAPQIKRMNALNARIKPDISVSIMARKYGSVVLALLGEGLSA